MEHQITKKQKINALAKYLNKTPEEIKVIDNVYTINDNEYIVATAEEAYALAKQSLLNEIEDEGLLIFSDEFRQRILDRFVDGNWFEDALLEYYETYISELEMEDDIEYDTRLNAELIGNWFLTEDDFEPYTTEGGETDPYIKVLKADVDLEAAKDAYINKLTDQDALEWYDATFGEKAFWDAVKEYAITDMNELVESALSFTSGEIENILATADGKEIELENNLFAYKIN